MNVSVIIAVLPDSSLNIIRYLCADTEHDLFIIIGAITHAKVMCHCVVLVLECVHITPVCVHAYVYKFVPVCTCLCVYIQYGSWKR